MFSVLTNSPSKYTLEFVNDQGLNSIYNSQKFRKTCCKIRKIDSLKRALKGSVVWVTGLRADQSENRSSLPRIEKDSMTGIIKFTPLVDWNDLQLHSYLHSNSVPTNTLHRKGYPSIGCEP